MQEKNLLEVGSTYTLKYKDRLIKGVVVENRKKYFKFIFNDGEKFKTIIVLQTKKKLFNKSDDIFYLPDIYVQDYKIKINDTQKISRPSESIKLYNMKLSVGDVIHYWFTAKYTNNNYVYLILIGKSEKNYHFKTVKNGEITKNNFFIKSNEEIFAGRVKLNKDLQKEAIELGKNFNIEAIHQHHEKKEVNNNNFQKSKKQVQQNITKEKSEKEIISDSKNVERLLKKKGGKK